MPTSRLARIDDHEGHGICGLCGREGLRWIATVHTGTTSQAVGLECAKTVLGYRPAPKQFAWIGDFTPTAEHTDGRSTWVLWQHRRGVSTRETRDGVLTTVGGVTNLWRDRGWLTPAAV